MFVANANWEFGEQYEKTWEMVGENVGEVVVFQLEIPLKVVSLLFPLPPHSCDLY